MPARTWSGVEAAEMATGEEMATGRVMATGQVMVTGEARVQNIRTMLDSGIVALLLLLAIWLA